MEKLTQQQILDRAVLGVVSQGALSKSDSSSCAYRMTKGGKVLRCGVGHLIAPDLYAKAIEDIGVDAAFPDDAWSSARDGFARLGLALMCSGVDASDKRTVDFLRQIQTAHDCADDVAGFVKTARAIARKRRLKFPAVSA